ncbi:hypothetical protein BSLG_005653 [Batrachochytrium salamandrivorans]|nr:hypothetical protein BSLG_005653 [Batrachochytrium salamandrivorans]
MPAFDDHDSIMESQDFQFQPDSNPQISQNNSNTPLLAHQDTVSTTLDTILESTAQVSAVYHQMRTSWLNDQSLMKQKMIESEYQLQESQSLVSSSSLQLASISEESRNTFVRNRELLQQSSQMNSDKIIATVSPLLSECSLIKQSIVGIKDELATSTKTLFDDTRQESYSTEIATLADNLQKQNSLLENAYGELASTCTERDTAIERFKEFSNLQVVKSTLKERDDELAQAYLDLKEFSECTRNASELWEVKQADYVACINKLRLEIKTSEESMEEMQTKFDQVSKQLETTMSDLNKSMDDFQKQRELEMEQELCSKSVALDAAKSEIQVNVEIKMQFAVMQFDNDVLSLQRDLEEEQVKAAKEAQKYDALSIELSETCETVKKLQDHIVELQQAESDFRMNLDQQTLAHQHMSIAMLNNNLVDLQNERSNLASQLQQEKHDTEQKSIAHTSMVNDIQEELVKQLSDNTIIFAKYDLLLDSFSENAHLSI